jgi:hypothetical protein
MNIDKERIQSPSLATTVNGTTSTNVYLAYYDNINNEIRLHWGTFTQKNQAPVNQHNLFYDAYGQNGALNGKVVYDATKTNDDNSNKTGKYTIEYSSLIAGQTTKLEGQVKIKGSTTGLVQTPLDTRVFASDGTPVCAGQYVCIDALKGQGNTENNVTDDAVVAVWYDATNNQMLYSYNKSPSKITSGMFSQADTGWSKPEAIFGEGNGIGQYCKVALAKDGSAHVVAYDSFKADVLYAFIPSFDTPSGAKTCIVDSYGLVGTELNIDVALDANENPLPFISYYAGSNALPKIAKWNGSSALTASSLTTGADEDMFTGAWDISLIPTTSRISVDHINVGVWKDKNTGIIKDSTTGTNLTEQTGISYKSEVSRGNIYGNGSKNAILGYAINEGANGYIETAQMK